MVDYVTELARFADVYVLSDCELQPGQLDRLDGVVRGSWARRHGAHDFGSWSLLARELVGWDALDAYDEVLLANDSCWLLRPLDEVFARMDRQACDFWSLQVTARLFEPEPGEPQSLPLDEVKRDWIPRSVFRSRQSAHLGSYFLALRRPVLDDPGFRRRLDSVVPQLDHDVLVQKYEYGTTRYLVGQGFDFSTWLPDLRPNHPLYGPGAFDLLAEGFPVFKRRFLVANPYFTPGLAPVAGADARRGAGRAGRRVRAQPAPGRRPRGRWPAASPPIARRELGEAALAPGRVRELDQLLRAGREGVLAADPLGRTPPGRVVAEHRVRVGQRREPREVRRVPVDLDRVAEQPRQPGHVVA